MKPIFRAIKPWIKKYVIEQLRVQQGFVVNFLASKIKLPMSAEQEKEVLNGIYDGLETVITTLIEKV